MSSAAARQAAQSNAAYAAAKAGVIGSRATSPTKSLPTESGSTASHPQRSRTTESEHGQPPSSANNWQPHSRSGGSASPTTSPQPPCSSPPTPPHGSPASHSTSPAAKSCSKHQPATPNSPSAASARATQASCQTTVQLSASTRLPPLSRKDTEIAGHMQTAVQPVSAETPGLHGRAPARDEDQWSRCAGQTAESLRADRKSLSTRTPCGPQCCSARRSRTTPGDREVLAQMRTAGPKGSRCCCRPNPSARDWRQTSPAWVLLCRRHGSDRAAARSRCPLGRRGSQIATKLDVAACS